MVARILGVLRLGIRSLSDRAPAPISRLGPDAETFVPVSGNLASAGVPDVVTCAGGTVWGGGWVGRWTSMVVHGFFPFLGTSIDLFWAGVARWYGGLRVAAQESD